MAIAVDARELRLPLAENNPDLPLGQVVGPLRGLVNRGKNIASRMIVSEDNSAADREEELFYRAEQYAGRLARCARPFPNFLDMDYQMHGAIIRGFAEGVTEVLTEGYPPDEEDGQQQFVPYVSAFRFPVGRMGYNRGVQLAAPEPFLTDDPKDRSIERAGHSIGMAVVIRNRLGVAVDLVKAPSTDAQFNAFMKGLNAVPVREWLNERADLHQVIYQEGLRIVAESTQVNDRVAKLGIEHPFTLESLSPHHRIMKLQQIVQGLA